MKLINYEDVVDIVFDNYNEDLEDILDLLLALPKTDVVRCKDCMHWNITSDGFGECNVMEKQFLGKEYCSFGERPEDGN